MLQNVSAPPVRRGDYQFFPRQGFFKMHIEAMNWFEARDTCYLEGGHLVIVNSEEEAAIIRTLWRKHPKILDGWRNSCAYVGIHDQVKEGEFITVHGKC